jgi:hypothetical protein
MSLPRSIVLEVEQVKCIEADTVLSAAKSEVPLPSWTLASPSMIAYWQQGHGRWRDTGRSNRIR